MHIQTSVTLFLCMTISSLPDPADQPFSFSGVLSASLGRRHLFRPFHLSGALACFYGGNRERGGGRGTGRAAGSCPCLRVPGLNHSSFPSLPSPPLCSAKPRSRCLSAEEFCH
ncbi:hypothetical protein KUCAC02_023848 [Chaenocephalus aceratus]|uniref:Uncharacterized protein n=1 Tax=Chaenocephalus aceratus TaxID=36190 RepID=A0ACB9WH01_CHAAC|nr:hypothetical protein KUCAC02_023848 [Chaenocephalus aceratus]